MNTNDIHAASMIALRIVRADASRRAAAYIGRKFGNSPRGQYAIAKLLHDASVLKL